MWVRFFRPAFSLSPSNPHPISLSFLLRRGAARNTEIRQMMEDLAREHTVEAIFPPLSLCTGALSYRATRLPN
jgi:hypothetical protein